jgi:hypothetical protein
MWTGVRPFFTSDICVTVFEQSYLSCTLCCGKAQFPSCLECLAMDFCPWYTFSSHKSYYRDAALLWCIMKADFPHKLCYDNATGWWSSESISLSHRESVLLPAHKITTEATTRRCKINKYRNFPTHLHTFISRVSFCADGMPHNKLYKKTVAWGWL